MNFSVTVLGVSSAMPNSKRHPVSHLVNIHERLFLVDCGEGTQIQLRRNRVRMSRIKHIFISHLHGDHVYGLFGLLSTFSLLGREHPLHLYAHPELKELLDYHNHFFQTESTYELIFHPIEHQFEGVVYEEERLTVEVFKLNHSVPSHGFLFKEKPRLRRINKIKAEEYQLPIQQIVPVKKGADYITPEGKVVSNAELTLEPSLPRSFAYCSDTAYYPNIVSKIEGIDLLYHEATFAETEKDRAKATKHSTSLEAAQIAKQAKVKKMIIGHFSARYKDLNVLLEEAQSLFPNTDLAEESTVYKIEEVIPGVSYNCQ